MSAMSRVAVRPGSGLQALVLVVASGIAAGGCSAGTTSKEDFEAEWGFGIGTEDLFGGADSPDLVKEFAAKLGARPIRAKSLTIYPSYAVLEAQDPKKRDNVDSYTHRDGTVGSAVPVRVTSSIEAALFTLDDVALEKLPDMFAKGREELRIEDARSTHVVVHKVLGGVRVCAHFSSQRRSGSACFDTKGKLINADKH